jgi:hypothetical protein
VKIISIGDVHGRPYWKQIEPKKYDKIIFTGDFVDSYNYSNEQILVNLMEIIELKKDFPDKVILILGNHDLHYMWNYKTFGCSGYRPALYHDLHDLFNDNRNLFQIAFQIGNHIWTHAGISKGWYNFNKGFIEHYLEMFKPDDNRSIDGLEIVKELNLADVLNIMLWTKDNHLLHQVSDYRGGVYQYGGITWADRKETINGYLPGYHQIVGHTPINEITMFGDEKGSIRYIDVQRNQDDRDYDDQKYFEAYKEERKHDFPLTLFYECEL